MSEAKERPFSPSRVLALLGVLLALVVVAAGWWWTRPLVSAATVAEVGELAAEAFVAARRTRCPRPVLRGTATPGDGTAELRAILAMDGRFGRCFTSVGTHAEDLSAAMCWTHEDAELRTPEEAMAASPPALEAWEQVFPTRPLNPVRAPAELAILADCAGLDDAIAHALQYESVCTNFPIGDEPPSTLGILRASRALGVIARERIRTGHLREGMEALLDAIRLGDDVQRGRASLIAVMMSVAAIDIALGQLQGLIATDLAWQPGELEALERQALVLARSQSAPERVMVDDSTSFARDALEHHGWSVPEDIRGEIGAALPFEDGPDADRVRDVFLGVVAMGQPRLSALCTHGETRQACRDAWMAERERAASEAAEDGGWAALAKAFPAFGSAIVTRAAYAESVRALVPYLDRVAISEATVRALPILFVHRRLAIAQGCVDGPTLEAAVAALALTDGFGGDMAILPSARERQALDVCIPAWLTPSGTPPGSVRLPELTAYCPAFAASAPSQTSP